MTLKDTFSERIDTFKSQWDDYLGDCKVPAKHINRRLWHSSLWSLIKFLDVYFRSIGEVRQSCDFRMNRYDLELMNELLSFGHNLDSICEQPLLWSFDPGFYFHWTYKSRNRLCSRR